MALDVREKAREITCPDLLEAGAERLLLNCHIAISTFDDRHFTAAAMYNDSHDIPCIRVSLYGDRGWFLRAASLLSQANRSFAEANLLA
jgi:hypothetical protein